jgi:hypothetical protein
MSPHSPSRFPPDQSTRGNFCQMSLSPVLDFIDRPNPAELRQDVLVQLLQRHTGAPTCEALVDQEPKLTSVLYRNARADFFRRRVGRIPVRLIPIDEPALEAMLAEPETDSELPLLLEIDLLNRVRSLGRPLIREVIETMADAQRARRKGTIPSDLRQRIYRLRRRTGLPLRTDLL